MKATAWIGFAIVSFFVVSGCGSDNGGPTTTTPTPPTNTSSSLTIHVAEINGPFSFIPSPVTVQSGQIVVWQNSDNATHHVVFDDGSVDTGTLAPGTLSQPKTIGGSGGTYHCAIHPSMVGRIIVGSASPSVR